MFDVAVIAACSPQVDGVPPGAEQAGGAVQAAPAAVRAQLVDAARVALAAGRSGHENGEERGSAQRQLPHALQPGEPEPEPDATAARRSGDALPW